MKIEKLTDNKIRIILNLEDMAQNNVDMQAIITNSKENQNLLEKLLSKAEKEVGFVTQNSKVLIEAIASSEGEFVFTITKLSPDFATVPYSANIPSPSPKKKIIARHKTSFSKKLIYHFDNFDIFCDFCSYIKNSQFSNLKDFSKDISLFLYNDSYILVISEINPKFEFIKQFKTAILEFANKHNYSSSFENKLLEHGKCLFKKNAISKCIKLFVH